MKITSLLFFLLINIVLFGQKNGSSNLSIKVENGSVKELFSQIETQTNLKFSYNTQLVNKDSIVSFVSNKQNVSSIISEVFADRITAKIIGNHIVLIEKHKKEKHTNDKSDLLEFKGLVINARSNEPIANANIYDIATRKTVLSDSLGRFNISVSKNIVLRDFNIAKNVYKDTIISVDISKQDSLVIMLLPITEKIERIKAKEAIEIEATKSDIVGSMVSNERIVTSENLKHISEKQVVQVSFLPLIGSNFLSSGIVENNWSLNVLGGYNGALKGVEVGGLFNFINRDMVGFQTAGLLNIVKEKTIGMQTAGLFNIVTGKTTGFQAAGISNTVTDTLYGMQTAGILNFTLGKTIGLQTAGLFNLSIGKTYGVQTAALLNLTTDTSIAVQVSGLVNFSAKVFNGIQISTISNVSMGKTRGLQVSVIDNLSIKNMSGIQTSVITNQALAKMNGLQVSLINFAKVSNGLQIGLINVSDTSHGVAIGLFNYVRNGYIALEASGNEVLYGNLTFKSGAKHFYTIYSAGYSDSPNNVMGFGFGFGSKININKKISVSIDATTNYIVEDKKINLDKSLNVLNRFDLTFDYNITKHLAILIGPAYNIHVSQRVDLETGALNSNIAVSPFYNEISNYTLMQMWIGGKVGLRVFF